MYEHPWYTRPIWRSISSFSVCVCVCVCKASELTPAALLNKVNHPTLLWNGTLSPCTVLPACVSTMALSDDYVPPPPSSCCLNRAPQRATINVLLLQRPLPANSASVSLVSPLPSPLPCQIRGLLPTIEKTPSTLPSPCFQHQRVTFTTTIAFELHHHLHSLSTASTLFPLPPQPQRLLHSIRSHRLLKGWPRSWIKCPENRIGDFHA